jgi:hypothetical protein
VQDELRDQASVTTTPAVQDTPPEVVSAFQTSMSTMESSAVALLSDLFASSAAAESSVAMAGSSSSSSSSST